MLSFLSSRFERLFTKIKENKKLRFVVILICVVIILFMIFYDTNKNKKGSVNNQTVSEYVQGLEKNLIDILSKIDGAGNVDVMITLESGNETVLASKTTKKESNGKIEIEETPILVNGKTVVLKENYPKIQGVIIVCEGAKKIAVVNAIKNATTSLLNIENEKIQVLKMK